VIRHPAGVHDVLGSTRVFPGGRVIDLQEVYDTERQLLYVACTRARDHLLVTGIDPVSEFLDDITKGDQGRTGQSPSKR
jgi:superfamily I DNA/RNA helicase